jgi:hypothetical protein
VDHTTIGTSGKCWANEIDSILLLNPLKKTNGESGVLTLKSVETGSGEGEGASIKIEIIHPLVVLRGPMSMLLHVIIMEDGKDGIPVAEREKINKI